MYYYILQTWADYKSLMRKRNREETTVSIHTSDVTIKEEDTSGSDPLDISSTQPLTTLQTTSRVAAQSQTPSPRSPASHDDANPQTNSCPAKRSLEENEVVTTNGRNISVRGRRESVTPNRRYGSSGRFSHLSHILQQAKETNKYRRMKLKIENQKLKQLVEIKNILKEYVKFQHGCCETTDSVLHVDVDDNLDSISDDVSFGSEV